MDNHAAPEPGKMQDEPTWPSRLRSGLGWLKRRKRSLDAFLFGAAMSWVMPPYMMLRRDELERLFVLTTSSRFMGVPVLPQIYSLKLLPHLVPVLLSWRRFTIFDHVMEGADLKHLGH